MASARTPQPSPASPPQGKLRGPFRDGADRSHFLAAFAALLVLGASFVLMVSVLALGAGNAGQSASQTPAQSIAHAAHVSTAIVERARFEQFYVAYQADVKQVALDAHEVADYMAAHGPNPQAYSYNDQQAYGALVANETDVAQDVMRLADEYNRLAADPATSRYRDSTLPAALPRDIPGLSSAPTPTR